MGRFCAIFAHPANRPKPLSPCPPKGRDWLMYVVPSRSLTAHNAQGRQNASKTSEQANKQSRHKEQHISDSSVPCMYVLSQTFFCCFEKSVTRCTPSPEDMPACSRDATLRARVMSFEKAHEDRAKSQLLAIRTASSSELFFTYK